MSKLKLHFIHAGKADTRESSFRLALRTYHNRPAGLVRNNDWTIMYIISTSSLYVCVRDGFLRISPLALRYRPLLLRQWLPPTQTTLIPSFFLLYERSLFFSQRNRRHFRLSLRVSLLAIYTMHRLRVYDIALVQLSVSVVVSLQLYYRANNSRSVRSHCSETG